MPSLENSQQSVERLEMNKRRLKFWTSCGLAVSIGAALYAGFQLLPNYHTLGSQQVLSVAALLIGGVLAFFVSWRVFGGVLTAFELSVRSEVQMRRLMELSGDWYWQQNTSQVMTRIVHRGLDVTESSVKGLLPFVGKRRDQIDGLRFLSKQFDWESFRRNLDAHRPFERVVFEYWPQDRSRLIFESTGRPVFGLSHQFEGYEGVSSEITQKWLNEKLLSVQRYFLQGVLLSAPLTDLVRTYANGLKECLSVRCEMIMGFRDGQPGSPWHVRGGSPGFRIDPLIGEKVWSQMDTVLSPAGSHENKGMIRVGLLDSDLIPEGWKTDYGIQRVWLELKRADGPGQPEYWILVAQKTPVEPLEEDITRVMTGLRLLGLCVERRVFEDELLRVNSHLEERIESRTAELTASNKELEAFTYTVSHDLRAPLRAIDGFSSILREDYLESLPEDARDLLDRISSNAHQMGQLIDGLLNFSRQLRTDLVRVEVNLQEMVDGILDQLDARAHAKIVMDPLPTSIMVDPVLISQVWQNLIDNALKFSAKKEEPEVRIDCELIEGGYRFSVKDNGAGFDMKYADKLFRVFERLHQKRDFDGTGVGLAIVKRIVERHHGEIQAQSAPGEGAQFTFTIMNESGLS